MPGRSAGIRCDGRDARALHPHRARLLERMLQDPAIVDQNPVRQPRKCEPAAGCRTTQLEAGVRELQRAQVTAFSIHPEHTLYVSAIAVVDRPERESDDHRLPRCPAGPG